MIKINTSSQLYVIPCGKGYTCMGFDNCQQKSELIASWIKTHNGQTIQLEPPGTTKAYEKYLEICNIAQEICNTKKIRCEIELTPQLLGKEGQRVEIIDKYGEKRRFIVGKSTGWLPCHLEIKTKRSTGGISVTGTPFKTIKIV